MGCIIRRGCACFRSRSRSTLFDYDSSSVRSDLEIPPPIPRSTRPPPRTWKRKQNFLCRNFMRRIFCCFRQERNMTKLEKTVKATLLIQRWFRRYMARLELRRRYTWNIFQSLEYAGEQDQVKLYNFFNALLTHIPETTQQTGSTTTSRTSSMEELNMTFEDESENDDELEMSDKDRHFKLTFPLTEESLRSLMDIYKTKRHYRLHAKYVADVLKRSIVILKRMANLNQASTGISKQITICGDLHGKFDDLLAIFHKNGLPSSENPYVFNGDFVDRGRRGLEVLITLLCLLLLYPNSVYLNRGNHEDHIMNSRYGFIREMQIKYKRNSEKLLKLIEGVYRWLPLGTIVNSKVLIVHGGISDTTDLDLIMSLDRGKYVSLLRPPLSESSAPGMDAIDKVEWKQVFDILWSDPQPVDGCVPNGLRGAGTYFGPNVTKTFLENNRMTCIIRSHECKVEGYEITHDDKVITIFSASNYYEIGSNKGAYVTLLGPDLSPHFVQYTSPAGKSKNLTFYQKMGVIESSVVREIHGQIMNNKCGLEREFANADPDNTGYITISDWCKAMEVATRLELPWRMLRDKIAYLDPDSQLVYYSSTFENMGKRRFNSVQGTSTVLETLYKNKRSLEAIFRIIDKDNSGYISLDEFSDACNLIKEYIPCPMTHEQVVEICHLMDLNKDGLVDLNEFLESFRMVDLNCCRSRETDKENNYQNSGTNHVTSVDVNKKAQNKTTPKLPSRKNSNSVQNDSQDSSPRRRESTSSIKKTHLVNLNIRPSGSSEMFTISPNASYVKLPPTSPTKQIGENVFQKRESLPKNECTSKEAVINSSNSIKSLNHINISISGKLSDARTLPKSFSDADFVNTNDTCKISTSSSTPASPRNVLNKPPVLSIRRGSQI